VLLTMLGAIGSPLLYEAASRHWHGQSLFHTSNDMILLVCVAWISAYVAWSAMTLLIERQQPVL
jgi:hypothetical protein